MKNLGRLKICSVLLFMLSTKAAMGHIRDPKFEQISMDRGLSHPAVSCVMQDGDGFMWFGTQDGLNRFDGYNFLILRNSLSDTTTLPHNWVTCMCQTDQNSLWIGTRGGGLCRFNNINGKFTRFLRAQNETPFFADSTINALLFDGNHLLWIGTPRGLFRLNLETGKINNISFDDDTPSSLTSVISLAQDQHKDIWVGTVGRGAFKIHHEMIQDVKQFYFHAEGTAPGPANTINTIYQDGDNKMWLGSEALGLIYIDDAADTSIIYKNQNAVLLGQGANNIRNICEDQTGIFWVGTAGAGINTFDRTTGIFYGHKCPENTVCCLGNNYIHAVACDKTGIIWLATDCCGVNKFVPERMQIAYRDTDLRSPNKLSQNRVWSFWEDSYGVLWIATSDGLKQLVKKTNSFKHHSSHPDDPSTLSNNAVTIIYQDSKERLWIGTEDGLNLYNRQTDSFKRFKFDPQSAASLSDNGIVAIEEDHEGAIWIGTRIGGLNRYDPKTDTFQRIDHDPHKVSSMANSSIMTILQSASHKSLWIGTFNGGLVEYNYATRQFNHYLHSHGDKNSISHNTVYAIYEDALGILWIGTNGGGLNRFDPATKQNKTYSIADGLLSNQILNIIGDNNDSIWISTSEGLCVFDPSEERFVTFHLADDLHSNLFDRGAFYKNEKGEFYYGTAQGIHKFIPDSLAFTFYTPTIVLTGLKVKNETKSYFGVRSLEKLKLRYDQNYFTFDFAVLDFRNPAANKYAYRLLDMDDAWIDAGHDRSIKYSNVQPGNYTLEVRGRNADGIGVQSYFTLPIRIAPPPWRSWWAYLLYVVVITALILIFWQATLKRERLKNQLKLEKFQGERLQELDQLKSRFFANISHEFRSPLTLILGPLERISATIKDGHTRDDINMIKKNAGKLLKLINQLLDLSRLEAGKMILRVKEQNIVSFVKEILLSFSALAESKGITLSFLADDDDVRLYFDGEVIDKIITNLVSNAVKFTTTGGIVTVSIIQHNSGDSHASILGIAPSKKSWGDWVQISVSDTGPGIPLDKIDKIFDHFYQYSGQSNSGENIGSGIGLALAKELVELHKGRIIAGSKIGVGTIITVTLPGGISHFAAHEIADSHHAVQSKQQSIMPVKKQSQSRYDHDEYGEFVCNSDFPCVLIVDDNKDIRSFVKKSLTGGYHVIEANNGVEGWNSAIENIPDLIISDVVMPDMNGIKLCNNLKSDERTNHIPVILLTVRAAEEDKIEGLQYGADEYMTKPFDANELLVRVDNLIKQRQRLRNYYNKSLSLNDVAAKDIDHQFLQRAVRIVEKHLANPDFSVTAFCKELGISRPQLHRKMTALTNQSTSKFIRTIRLKHAAGLLATRSGNVFEVAQEVGFNNLSYFAKCFHEQYDMSPSEYLAKAPAMN